MKTEDILPYDKSLTKRCFDLYNSIKQNYRLGRFEECVEKVGKLVEVIIRLLQLKIIGTFTPLDQEIKVRDELRKFENLPSEKYSVSERLLLPKILAILYTFRNKRGGAHVKEISPYHIDASFIAAASNWVIAEIIRLNYRKEDVRIEALINSLSEKRIPTVQEFEKELIVLDETLTVKQEILLILYKKHPNYVSIIDLKRWVKRKNVPQALHKLSQERMIFKHNGEYVITYKGICYIENLMSKNRAF